MILDVGGERWHFGVDDDHGDNGDLGGLDIDAVDHGDTKILSQHHLMIIMMLLLIEMMLARMLILTWMMMLSRFTAMRATLEKHPATRLGKLMRAASIAKVVANIAKIPLIFLFFVTFSSFVLSSQMFVSKLNFLVNIGFLRCSC